MVKDEGIKKVMQQSLSRRVSRRRIVGLMAVIGIVLLGACTSTPQSAQPTSEQKPAPAASTSAPKLAPTAPPVVKGGKITLASTNDPSGLDPHVQVVWDVMYILGSVYDPLVWQAPDGKFVPGLASSWEITDDGKTYTFRLRKDVKFHDGTPFNAAAVKFNIDRIMDPATKSQAAAGLLGPYESGEVVDEYTFRLKLKEPYAFVLQGLALPYVAMASPEAIKKWGAEYQLHQVGTGPFIFKEYVRKDHLTLVRNPDYNWAPSFFSHQGPAYLEQITWKFLPEGATRVPALEAGDIDISFDIPPSDGNRLKNDTRFDLMLNKLAGQPLYYFMNTQREATSDLKVRQAILHGVDRQAIVNTVLRGFYPVANGPLTAVTPEYNRGVEGMYPYDVAKAKALLDEAGWKVGSSGIREKDGKHLVLTMTLQKWGYIPPIAEMMQSQLKQIGIDAKAEMMTFPGQMEAGIKGERNMTVNGGSGFFASDALIGFFHSKNAEKGFNWSKVKDPDLDASLDNGAKALDIEKRKEIYGKTQTEIMKQALIVPIYDYTILIGASKKVKGILWHSIGLMPWLYDAYIEK